MKNLFFKKTISIYLMLIMSISLVAKTGKVLNSEVEDTTEPTLTLVSPYMDQTLTTDKIVLTFKVSGIPLDGSFKLNAHYGVINYPPCIQCEPPSPITEFSIPITSEEINVTFSIFDSEISTLYYTYNNTYGISASIKKDEMEEPVVSIYSSFNLELPEIPTEYVWLTPAPQTTSNETLEVEFQVSDEVKNNYDYCIYYSIRINNEFSTSPEQEYKEKIVFEGHGNYSIEYYVKVRGYNILHDTGRYAIKNPAITPTLSLTSPKNGEEFTDKNIQFVFKFKDAIMDGNQQLRLSLKGLWVGHDDIIPSYWEDTFSISTPEVIISRYLIPNEYELNAHIYDLEKGEIVDKLEPIRFWVRKKDFSENDVKIEVNQNEDLVEIFIHVNTKINDTYINYAVLKDGTSTDAGPYEGGVFFNEPGTYEVLFHISHPDYNDLQIKTGPYTIAKGGNNIENTLLESIKTEGNTLYVPTIKGENIEIYTTQGTVLYKQLAASEATIISGLPFNQILLIRRGENVSKIIILE